MPEASPPRTYALQEYKTDVHVDWCPGCGDFGILSSIQQAFYQLQLPPHRIAMISGIGCSGKTPHYVDTYGLHTLHGRALPVATGAKLANHELTVVAVGGDGDGYGIGAGYFLNSGRRNLDITYIVFNNGVYGLTKGQASPTLAKGLRTKSMPEASIQEGINPIAVALGAGYTWIGRGYALDVKHLVGLIVEAIQHRGTAFLDVFQTCPVYNDLRTKEWYAGADIGRPRLRRLDQDPGWEPHVRNPRDVDEIVEKKVRALQASYETGDDRLAIGVFYQVDLPTYDEQMAHKVPALKDHPLVDLPLDQRNIEPLLRELE
ncbi:MAG TPA: thiamine pyrophosphate-dependent enzyme [Candidatus Limnocylindrales bacterium]|nr:thiamine pyrophosphate-dependent enzyme [Candidatus Limnocylindrales bacterium]